MFIYVYIKGPHSIRTKFIKQSFTFSTAFLFPHYHQAGFELYSKYNNFDRPIQRDFELDKLQDQRTQHGNST